MVKRKSISKKIKDQILVDCMHRCCLCPEHQEILDLHHIIQISEDGSNTEDNLMAICPTCHAKIHRIRGRYNVEQLKMYKNRWVELCWKKEIPLEEKIAQAPSIKIEDEESLLSKVPDLKGLKAETIEEQEISTIDYNWIMNHSDLEYDDPNRILKDRCAPTIDKLCKMANKNEIYSFTKLLNSIENSWKNINQNLDIDDNIKPVTSFFLDHYRTLLDFIFNHNIFNDIYDQAINSLERVAIDLISLKNVNNKDKISELLYFNNFVRGYIPILLKGKEKNINARVLIEFIATLHIKAIKNGIDTFVLSITISDIFNEYINNLDEDLTYFSLRLVDICKENINHNQKDNVKFIIEDIFEALEKSRGIFEYQVINDLCRWIILIWMHILFNKKTKMYDLIKIPHNLVMERDVYVSFKMAFENIEKYERDRKTMEIIEIIKQKIYKSEPDANISQEVKSLQPKLLQSQETARSKIFISYSIIDKQFVDRLVNDLGAKGVNIWFDKREIKVGDSIIDKINEGLIDSDYFAIVISPDSMKSAWVKEELNAAMTSIIKNEKVLLPILLKGCKLPPMLAHRRYADFRTDYQKGLNDLLEVPHQDQKDVSDKKTIRQLEKPCALYSMNGAQLRKLLNKRLQLREIKDICFDLDEPDYENLPGEIKNEKIIELLIYYRNRNKMNQLLNWLKDNRPDLC